MTATALYAGSTVGSILAVTVAGTLVPLPSAQLLPVDITVDGTNTVFTVLTAGRYRISYHVNTQAALIAGTRIMVNGSANIPSTVAPILSLSTFSNEILIDLAANTTISLQMFGILSASTLLSGAAGASLMMIRLS